MKVLLTSSDISKALKIHVKTVRRWRVEGKLKAVKKVGKQWLYSPSVVKDFMEQS